MTGTLEKPDRRRDADGLEFVLDVLTAATRYDLALWIIPAAFLLALVAAGATGVAVVRSLVVASAIATLVIVDVCYVHPPVDADGS